MKVVIAHNQYVSAQPSGENTLVDREIELLSGAGVEVLPFLRSSDEIPSLPVTEKALLPVSPFYAPRAHRELVELLTRERPDVLHLHNPYPLLSPWVIRTAHAHRVPVVHTVHNFRQVCVKATYFRDGHPCHLCRGRTFGWPAVRYACYRGSRPQSLVMAGALAAHRGTWHSVDRFIALTDAMADHLRDYGIPDARITVKPNSVPDPGPPAPSGSGFLFVGRLSEEKGVPLLLEAWHRFAPGSLGRLTVIGDGPLRDLVTDVARTRDDVHFLGRQDPARVREEMRAAATLVVTSTWDEVCPMVVVEALSEGCPVLVTAKGGLPYLVGADRDEPAGWVAEPSVDGIVDGLRRAVDKAADTRVAARRRYETTFSPRVVTGTLLRVYDEVAGTRR